MNQNTPASSMFQKAMATQRISGYFRFSIHSARTLSRPFSRASCPSTISGTTATARKLAPTARRYGSSRKNLRQLAEPAKPGG